MHNKGGTNNKMTDNNSIILQHPCFQKKENARGRIHLPVAKACNIHCVYCNPTKNTCFHGCRPGLAAQVITANMAMEKLKRAIFVDENLLVVGVAGPGEPLLSDETFKFFEQVRAIYPHLLICVSTNGLLLPEKAEQLSKIVDAITVTVNALTLQTAKKMYQNILGKTDDKYFEKLLHNQWHGIELAVQKGIPVKINTVLVNGINNNEVVEIAKKAADYKIYTHNIMPVIANAKVSENEVPPPEIVQQLRSECEKHIAQFTGCKQCRADVFIPSCNKQ